MSNLKKTFLDFPLDRELYRSKPAFFKKNPIKILITDAGNKCAYCLIYKICTGEVFGQDQEFYIHMTNSKGVTDHKAIFFELEECGFHLFKGWVVSSNAEEAYKDIDVVIIIGGLEEQSGFSHKETLVSQMIKGRQTMKNISEYAKPNVKIIITGPSSKTVLLQLFMLSRLEPKIPYDNFSGVTLLDEAISRANLAARLKTTTNKIKNIVIWGTTCADVHNATVRMLPPGDLGALDEVEVPVHEALLDDNYLHDEFVECIYKRKIGSEFSRSGKSIAFATVRHLKALFQGTTDDEIVSMGVLTPSDEPYMVAHGTPFSFPVTAGNGKWEIKRGVKQDMRTHLNLIKVVHSMLTDKIMTSVSKAIEYILEYEESKNDTIRIGQKQEISEILETTGWNVSYYFTPLLSESAPRGNKEKIRARKSITWDDEQLIKKKFENFRRKSSIRFSVDEGRKNNERKSSIMKRSGAKEQSTTDQV